MNELLEQFVIESRELVEQATHDFLELEKTPADRERLDSAFRAFHTLKGGAGIVEFAAMENAVHAAESVLAAVRAGTRVTDAGLIGDCLTCLDQVVQWLDLIQGSGALPQAADGGPVITRFARAMETAAPAAVPVSADDLLVSTNDLPVSTNGRPAVARMLLEAQVTLLAEAEGEGAAARIASAGRVAVSVLQHAGRHAEADALARATDSSVDDRSPHALRIALAQVLAEPGVEAAAAAMSPTAPTGGTAVPVIADTAARTLRVDAARVDELVNLAGELAVVKNALGLLARRARTEAATLAPLLHAHHTLLTQLSGRLQRAVLGMRVLPFRHVFQRFPRLLREISAELDKPLALVIEGEDTEADKAVVEMLFDPLLHVLRNAVDHGIESPSVRSAAGKAATATIRLSARREGEQVVVEVEDDGGGIDVAKVGSVALQRGLVTEQALAAMTAAEVTDLIFTPGFSTAETVTALSGRGVGLDVVRAAVHKVSGKVGIASRPGLGTALRFTLPFSVMMNQVMTVEAGGQMFGIPLEAVIETVRVKSERIAPLGAMQAVVLRDRTLPLIALASLLGLREATTAPPATAETNPPATAEATLLVVAAGGEWNALQVDAVGERMEVLLKPLSGLLSAMPGIAGSAVMGDGRVLLVLDMEGLVR